MKRRASDDLLVLTKTYDLLLWYTGHISRFPKQPAIHFTAPLIAQSTLGPVPRSSLPRYFPSSEQIFQGMAHIDAAGRPAAE